MNEEFNDCNQELITSEKLKSFSVLEKFCQICGDLTPHHIEDQDNSSIKRLSENKSYEAPISIEECVYCRESEEELIEGL
jgi:hypothetical protein